MWGLGFRVSGFAYEGVGVLGVGLIVQDHLPVIVMNPTP